MAAPDPALVIVPYRGVIEDSMHAIFASPVSAIEAQDRLGIGALRRVAGDAMDQLDAGHADACRLSIATAAEGPCGSLDQGHLFNPGEADARDRFGRSPELPLFNASVRRLRRSSSKFGLPERQCSEEGLDVTGEGLLVALGNEE